MPARERRSREPTRRHGRRSVGPAGVVLLDLVIALALFTVGGLAVLTQLESGARRIIQAEQRLGAMAMARTAMGLLETGAMGDRELNGPADAWASPSPDDLAAPGAASDSTTQWICEVELEPSQWPALSLATIRVRRVPLGAEVEGQPVLATLRQLVPTSGPGEGASFASGFDVGGAP